MSIEVTDEIPEDAVVCCVKAEDETPFEDNLIGECFKCGCKVQFRPYVPVAIRKVCLDCLVTVAFSGETAH